jgi:signal transduction histidine kinase
VEKNEIGDKDVTILVVDDEKYIRKIIKNAFATAGYHCIIASNVEEALAILSKNDIDIVITDIKMPDMDGIELLSFIKKKYNADVIVMTGYTELYTYDEILDLGASDFFTKPVSINEIIMRVKRVIRERIILRDLSMAKMKAEESDKLKSAFLANISHEIRTPLNGIIGFTNLMLESTISSEQRQYLEIIRESGKLLCSLIDDLLDLSIIESGHVQIAQTPFSLKTILENTGSHARLLIEQSEKNIVLHQNYTLTISDIITGDPTRLQQVLYNLIGNAVKFTEEGSIEYGVDIENSAFLLLYVKDTGHGIPKDRYCVIFDAFGQVDSSIRRKFGGTGLGLTISKKLVEYMGGKIWFESRTGKKHGTTFYFTIPYLPADEKEKHVTSYPKATHLKSGYTILIIEDDRISRMLVQRILEINNYSVIAETDGKEGFSRYCLLHDSIDCILMDIQLPFTDGFELTEKIRNTEKESDWKRTPIIALTASALKGEREKCINAGCDDYITKPLQQDMLVQILEKYIHY